jgi:hypothetical protein
MAGPIGPFHEVPVDPSVEGKRRESHARRLTEPTYDALERTIEMKTPADTGHAVSMSLGGFLRANGVRCTDDDPRPGRIALDADTPPMRIVELITQWLMADDFVGE